MKGIESIREEGEDEKLKRVLSQKIDFISSLGGNEQWVDDAALVEEFFSAGEELLDNAGFIQDEMVTHDAWEFIEYRVYDFLHTEKKNILLDKALEYKDKFPMVANQILYIYEIQFALGPSVLEAEYLIKSLIKNTQDGKPWSTLRQFIYAAFDERVTSHAEQLIRKFESVDESILERGLFIDLIDAMIGSHLFDFHYLQNIKSVFQNIYEASDTSYFLKIKCRSVVSKLSSILESQTEEQYDAETNHTKNTSFTDEQEEDEINTSGYNLDEEYRSVISHMPGLLSLEEEKDSKDWEYLVRTCGKEIEKDFGELFFDISPKEQEMFLDFVKKKKDQNIDDIREFCKKYRRDGFLTFLSLELDTDLGNKIIELGKNLDKENVRKIFHKYAELISQTEKIEDILNDSYGRSGNDQEVQKIKEALLAKGKDLLAHFADLVAEGKEISTEEILAHLDRIEVEATTFFLTFKTLKEEKELPPLEEIKGLSFEKLSAAEISNEDKASMEELYAENYKNDPQFLAELLSKFKERAADPTTRFYILKYLGKLKASIAFTPDKERTGVVYGHSFNVEPSLRGIFIGNTMLERAKDQEAKENILTADCAAYAPIGAKNIETGYVARHFYLYDGHPSFFVERNDKNNSMFWGKRMSGKENEIVELSQGGHVPDGVKIVSGKEQKDISMEIINQGYLLTRYFRDSVSGKWYAVFEKLQT